MLLCTVSTNISKILLNLREKTVLHKQIEQLQTELQEVRDKCEDLRAARQEAVRELLTLQDQHRDEVRLIQADLQVRVIHFLYIFF